MTEQAVAGAKLKVFISYSRNDVAFVDQLATGLMLTDFEPLLDKAGISGGEDWRSRLVEMICEADTVVFVLSPDSARSEICAWEVEEAGRLGKRIIPVVCQPVDGIPPPSRVSALTYIYFYGDPQRPGSGFASGLTELVQALRTDLDWIRQHTRLGAQGSRWEARGRTPDILLRGSELADAKNWLAWQPRGVPEPGELIRAFILASDEAEAARASMESRRLEDREKLLGSGGQAIADRVAALEERERAIEAWAKVLEEKEAALQAGGSLAVSRALAMSRPAPKPRGTRIFISYRRSGSLHIAGRICDRLEKEFARGEVFFDVDAIPVGINFKQHIRGSLESSAVLLAVIGTHWSNRNWTKGWLRRWLDPSPEDHVQSEIELAFELGVPITPVLIDQTAMPKPGELPRTLFDMCDLNAASVRGGRDFHTDMSVVCEMIKELRRKVEAGAVGVAH